MNLYYSPGACALASPIILREAGMNFDIVNVDLKAKQYAGGDFKAINPKGYVPALQMKSGEVLTEGSVILQWIADQVPEKNLIPKHGTPERYKAMEWLNYIATELHKGLGSLFSAAAMSEESIKMTHDRLQLRLAILDKHLQTNEFILGKNFSVVDAYAYNILRWAPMLKVDLSHHHALQGLINKMAERPTVRDAVAAEGVRL